MFYSSLRLGVLYNFGNDAYILLVSIIPMPLNLFCCLSDCICTKYKYVMYTIYFLYTSKERFIKALSKINFIIMAMLATENDV